MDAEIAEFLKGPPSGNPVEMIDWFYRIEQSLRASPDRSLSEVADPLKEAADLLLGVKDAPEAEVLEAKKKLDALLVKAQALALRAYLVQVKKVKEAVREEASRHKQGTALRTQFDAVGLAYEQTLLAVSAAYNDALVGKTEALSRLPAELARISAALPPVQK